MTATYFRERCREHIGGFTVAPYAGIPRRWPTDPNYTQRYTRPDENND